jgi:hypothetical protein
MAQFSSGRDQSRLGELSRAQLQLKLLTYRL